jgi:hypothetical protein
MRQAKMVRWWGMERDGYLRNMDQALDFLLKIP